MIFQSPGDVAFHLFGYSVYFYGIILAIAIFSGIYMAYFLYKKFYDIEFAEKIFDIAPFMIIIGIVGARLYYCIVNYKYYSGHLCEIFDIRQGGLSIHGMLILGIAALFWLSRRYKMSFGKLSDVLLCATALAQSIGRWGNFFNSEAFGTPTNLPWGLFIPLVKRPEIYVSSEYFHPTFLYESILDFIIFLILFLLFKRFSKTPGIIACLYLILYSFARIFVEHFRVDSILNVGGFPIAQWVSVVLIFLAFVGMFFIVYLNNESKKQ